MARERKTAKGRQRKAHERELRGRLKRGRALAVAQEAIVSFQGRYSMTSAEAWAAVGQLMITHGREPTENDLERCLEEVQSARRSADVRARRGGVAAFYLFLAALGRWSLGRGGSGHRLMLPSCSRDMIKDLAEGPQERVALARAVAQATEGLRGQGTLCDLFAADGQCIFAVAVSELPEVDAREMGREILAAQVAEMERLLAGDLTMFGRPAGPKMVGFAHAQHGMALNNLAHAWEQRGEGDRAANLRRSIALYERCCALSARAADPDKLLFSLHHLALVLRRLAHESHGEERGELLRRSMATAERGLELRDGHAGLRIAWIDALRLNHANSRAHLLLHRIGVGELSNEAGAALLRQHAEVTLRWLGGSSIRDKQEGLAAVPFFSQLLEGQEARDHGVDAALQGLLLLSEQIAREKADQQRFLSVDEARLAISAVTALLGAVGQDSVVQGVPTVFSLPTIFGAVHPQHSGIVNARLLYALEIRWLQGLAPLQVWGGARGYFDEAFEAAHRWMCDPDLPSAHRRVYAAHIATLAALALDSESGFVEIRDIERVRLHDLSGSAFYRAESTFYGQGIAYEAPLRTEPGWRISLYRARQQMDACATIHAYQELAPIIDGVAPGASAELIGALSSYYQSTGDGVLRVRRIEDPLAEIAELRKEINEYRRHGVSKKWSPAIVDMTPLPTEEGIRRWIESGDSGSIMVAGRHAFGLLTSAQGREAEYISFADLYADSYPDLLSVAERVVQCWDEAHAGQDVDGRGGFGKLGSSIDALRRDRRWQALGERIVSDTLESGHDVMVIVERQPWRSFPWEAITVEERTLGEHLAVVHVASLAPTGAKPRELLDGVFAYVAVGGPEAGETEYGRAAFASAGISADGPLSREDFERSCAGAGALRIFAHGAFNQVDAPLSGIYLDQRGEQPAYQGYEIQAMDLRGCGRVEIWACESGIQLDQLGLLLANDEPLGLASSFLLAGARVVVGSIWKQPAIVAGLIAGAFAARAGAPGSAAADARALGLAVAAYRRAVADRGVFEQVFVKTLGDCLGGGWREGLIAEAMRVAWTATLRELTDCGAEIEPPSAAVSHYRHLDEGLLEAARASIDEQTELDYELVRCSRRMMLELRSTEAWAGWRVIARDVGSIGPNETRRPTGHA